VQVGRHGVHQTMNHIEAMKQALEALEFAIDQLAKPYSTQAQYAITALHQAIAEAEKQESVTQPKREWVGLTDEEIKFEAKYLCNSYYLENPERLLLLGRTIEAKLREKNT